MIPVRLRLRNFMSYGDEPQSLEFDSFHVACLCGENGHGKSALLDAITYALWGRARISERRDTSEDELIHLGKTEMEVEFELELDGQRYCVIRRRTVRETAKRRTSSGVLELQVRDGDSYRPLTGDSIHATQRKINEILRLDYETFVNSVFILQGRADEFTRKTATERKRILADLLNLGLYDELESRARETSREWAQKATENEHERAEIDAELDHEPEYKAQLARLDAQLAEVAAEIARVQADVDRHRLRVQALESKEAERIELEGSLRRTERELGHLGADRDRLAREVAGFEVVVANADQIRRGHAEYRDALGEREALDARASKALQIQQSVRKLSLVVAKARAELERELSVVRAEVSRLRVEMAAEPGAREELNDLGAKLAALASLDEQRRERAERREALRNELGVLEARNQTITDEGKSATTRLEMLDRAGALCPVCSTPLDDAGRERARSTLVSEREEKVREYRDNKARIASVGADVVTLDKWLADAEKQVRARSDAERAHARAEQALEQVETATRSLGAAKERETELEARLAAGDYARLEALELARLETVEAALGYDAAVHEAARSREKTLFEYVGKLHQLETAERDLPEARRG